MQQSQEKSLEETADWESEAQHTTSTPPSQNPIAAFITFVVTMNSRSHIRSNQALAAIFGFTIILTAITDITATATTTTTGSGQSISNDDIPYGFDCSFAIMSTDLSNCPRDLGDKGAFYKDYMDGCRAKFGENCDVNEDDRIAKNIRQPASLKNFTDTGFMKIRAPDNVVELIKNFWEKNKDHRSEEEWLPGNIHTNHWAMPTDFVSVEDEELEGGGWDLSSAIADAAKATIEEWTGMKQRMSSVYGVRVYNEGAVLSPHCDRMPLISSAIVNVAQDVDEDWPIEVYGHDGIAVNVTMKPGDMVLYESGTIIHGRPFPLKGRYYANVFIHFEPTGFMDGSPFLNIQDPDLPPYIQAGSAEADYQHEEYLDWRQKHECAHGGAHEAVCEGDIDTLREYVEEDANHLHVLDADGWAVSPLCCCYGYAIPVDMALKRRHLCFCTVTSC